MVFLRRICSSHPGDGEQRGQSVAALTAHGRGLYCLQPQHGSLSCGVIRVAGYSVVWECISTSEFFPKAPKGALRPFLGRSAPSLLFMVRFGLFCCRQDYLYPYVDPDKITTMFLFATSPLLSQSGNTKSSIKGNTLNSDSLNRKSPCSSSLYKRRHCLPSVTSQTRLLLFNKCLWLHKQKIKSHHSSTRSAISLASLTASAS